MNCKLLSEKCQKLLLDYYMNLKKDIKCFSIILGENKMDTATYEYKMLIYGKTQYFYQSLL